MTGVLPLLDEERAMVLDVQWISLEPLIEACRPNSPLTKSA
jgi:hypothetical protein